MASSVDERIVAAKFDSSDFEKGVDRTIKKLDELKKSLNIKDAADSVKEMADKTEKSTESMSKSLEKLSDRFTSFTGMLKQKLLSGIADEIVGVFFKIENGIKSLIKSISTDQIGVGMGKYESILTSVRIMMSAGESQAAAYKQIGILRDYADQTSYSLSQMTDSLSKMRAAGVGLEQATKNVEGIANACAIAGINATDAGRAFYNLSQAYSSGGLKYTDYRSLEMLNMTTEQFKENMLEAAVAAGTLVKTAKGVYKTTNKKDKRVKAGKVVNKDNIRDALNYGFMNKEAMNELFGGKYYFDEDLLRKYRKEAEAAGLSDARQIRDYAVKKAKEEYGEVAVNAYLAAREARSLTDSLNTLKDAVSTGWATTFEHLFGKLEDAKEFFTDLVEGELAESIYAIADWRNTVLSYWNAFDAKGEASGGSAFRDAILNITDALGVLLKTILQLLPGFDELDDEGEGGQKTLAELGRKLFKFSVNVRNATIKVKEAMWAFNKWMNSPIFDEEGDAPSRIEVIRNAIANLGSVFGIAGKIISIAVTGIAKVLATLYPVFDAVFYAIEKVTQPLSDLNSNTKVFDDITMSISNLMIVLTPIAKVLSKVIAFLGDVAGFIAGMAIDGFVANISFFADAIGLFVELIFGKSAQLEKGEGILDKIRKDFEGIKEACASGLAAVKEFFTTLISDLRNLFGLTDKTTGEEGGAFAGLKKFFENNQFIKDAKAWVDQAIVDVGNFFKSIPERLKQFGSNIYETIRNLIFKEETKYNGSTLETKTVLTPLGEWLTSTIDSIKEFVKSIPNRIIDGVGKIGSWIDTIFNEWFGEKTTKEASDKSAAKAGDKETKQVVTSRFDEFVSGVVSSVGKWFSELPQKIKNAFKNIGDFVSRLFKAIDEFLFGKKINIYIPGGDGKKGKETTIRVKQGFSKFLDGIIKEVKKFIANIPKYIVSGINGIGDFITSIVNAILGRDPATGDSNISKTVEEKFKEPFKNVNLETILEPIKSIGKAIISNIVKIFTGSEDENINLQWLSDKIAEGIEWIRTKASQAFKWVTEFISTIPSRIASFFTDEVTGQQEAGPIGRALLNFGTTIGEFIQDLPSTLLTFFDNAIKGIGTLWNSLYKSIIGESDDSKKALTDAVAQTATPDAMKGDPRFKGKSKWDQFVENLGKLIGTAFEQLPVWIAQGIDLAIKALDDIIAGLGNWIEGIGDNKKLTESSDNLVDGVYENVEESTKEGGQKEEPALIKAIKSIGERIKKLFVETIPHFASQAWEEIKKLGAGAWGSIQNIFNGTPKTEFETAIVNFGESVKTFITKTLPDAIRDGFDEVIKFVKKLFGGKEEELNPLDDSLNSFSMSEKKFRHKRKNSFFDSLKQFFVNLFGDLFDEKGDTSKTIFQKISDFFFITIPKFLGKAIGGLVQKIPTVIASFSKGLDSTIVKNGQNLEKDAEMAVDTTNKISNLFATILEGFVNDVTQTGSTSAALVSIVKVIALVEALKAIRDIINTFNITGNLQKKAEATNSFLGVIRHMITGLIAAMAFIVYLTVIPDEKRKDAMTVLEQMISLFSKLAELAKVLGVAKTIKDVAGAAGDTWENVAAIKNGAYDAGEAAKKGLKGDNKGGAGGFTGVLTSILGAMGAEAIGNSITDIIADIMGLFEQLASGFKTVSQLISEAVGILIKIKDDIFTAIIVAEKAVELCKTLVGISAYKDNINDMQNYIPTFTGMIELFKTSVSGKWIKADELVNSINTLINMIPRMRAFAKFVTEEDFENFKYGIASIGAAMSMYNVNATGFSEEGISSAIKMLKAVLGDDDLLSLADKLKSENYPDARSMYAASEKLVILAGAILSIGKAAKGITEDMGTTLSTFFKSVSNIELDMTDDKLNETATKLGVLGVGLGTFASNTKDITKEKLDAVKYAIDIMLELGQSLKGTGQGFIEKLFEGDESIQNFGTNLDTFGTKLNSFFGHFANDGNKYNVDNVKLALYAIQEISLAYRVLNSKELLFKTGWNQLGAGLVGDNGFVGTFKTFIGELNTLTITDDQYKNLYKILSVLNILSDISTKGTKSNANVELGELANQLKPDNENGIGSAMMAFVDSVSKMNISEDGIKAIRAFSDTMVALADIAAYGLSGRSGGIAYNNKFFDDVTKAFGKFNDNFDDIKEFFSRVKEVDQDGIQVAKGFFYSLAELGRALTYFSNNDAITDGLTNLRFFDWTDFINSVGTNLNNAFIDNKDKIQPISNTIAAILLEGIQTAFNDPNQNLQPTITPVLDLTKAREQMLEFSGNYRMNPANFAPIVNATVGANVETDQRVLDYTQQLADIHTTIQAMADNSVTVGDITKAFDGMQMILDTNALVGALSDPIDRAIGLKIWKLNRHVTV